MNALNMIPNQRGVGLNGESSYDLASALGEEIKKMDLKSSLKEAVANEIVHADIDGTIRAYQHFLYYIDMDHLFENVEWEQYLKDHLRDKLKGFIYSAGKGCISVGTVVKWVQEISNNYQRGLFAYILKFHYNKW